MVHLPFDDADHNHPSQMPDRRHHDPHIEGELIRTALLEKLSLEEHAGPLAELNNGACHAFLAEGKMRRGVERDGVKLGDMANLVRALCTGVLTGHHVPAQVDGDGVGTVHPAFLAEGFDGPLALDRGIKLVDALAEAKSVRVLRQRLEDRPRQAIQLRGLEPPCPDGGRCVIDIHHALEAYEDVRSDLLGELSDVSAYGSK